MTNNASKTRLYVKLPSMVGTKEFEPTGLQIQTLCGYLSAINGIDNISPLDVLTSLGRATTNWYNWIRKPAFLTWWNRAIEEYFTGHGLKEVHRSIYRNALGNSAQDRKLFLERFDAEYKPTTKTEIDAYPGHRPEPEEAIARSNERIKAIQSTVIDTETENQ